MADALLFLAGMALMLLGIMGIDLWVEQCARKNRVRRKKDG